MLVHLGREIEGKKRFLVVVSEHGEDCLVAVDEPPLLGAHVHAVADTVEETAIPLLGQMDLALHALPLRDIPHVDIEPLPTLYLVGGDAHLALPGLPRLIDDAHPRADPSADGS